MGSHYPSRMDGDCQREGPLSDHEAKGEFRWRVGSRGDARAAGPWLQTASQREALKFGWNHLGLTKTVRRRGGKASSDFVPQTWRVPYTRGREQSLGQAQRALSTFLQMNTVLCWQTSNPCCLYPSMPGVQNQEFGRQRTPLSCKSLCFLTRSVQRQCALTATLLGTHNTRCPSQEASHVFPPSHASWDRSPEIGCLQFPPPGLLTA